MLGVDTVACLHLSNIVTQNDSVSQPAILFQTASLWNVLHQETEDKCCLKRLSYVSWGAGASFKTPSLILLYRRRPLAKRQTFSVNQKAVTPLALVCQNSLTLTGSMPDSRLVSDSLQRCRKRVRGWRSCGIQKTPLSKLWFLSRDSNEVKADISLFFPSFFVAAVITRAHQKNLLLSPYAVVYSFII